MKKRSSKEEKRARLNERMDKTKMVFGKLTNDSAKKEKVKSSVPIGYKVRRVGFFIGYGALLSLGLYACTGIQKHDVIAQQIKPPVVVQKQVARENPATSQAAVQFASDFLSSYFTWGTGDQDKQNRQDQLSTYLANGLDPEAGLNMDSINNKASFKSAEIKNIEDVGQNKAKLTFLVTYEVTTIPEKPADPKAPAPPASTPKQSTKAIVVPVQYDGQTYGIYQLPSFTTLPAKTTLVANADLKMTQVTDSNSVQDINNFLNTFFQSYSQDKKEQLSYILLDTKYQNGLQKSMSFIRVNDSKIYQGKSKNQYIVYCDVQMEDPVSKSQFITTYLLTVEKQGGNYVVTKIN